MNGLRIIRITMIALLTMASLARAAWEENGHVPDVIPGTQSFLDAAPDGAGGMIYTWRNYDDGEYHIYAQRIDAWGDALWQAGGVVVCSYPETRQLDPVIAPDGESGAYIAWEDYDPSTGYSQIYAERIDADGSHMWTAEGMVLSTGTNNQMDDLVITATDDGGAMVVWAQRSTDWDVYAMKLEAEGRSWLVGGVAVCSESANQSECQVTPLPGGGAIIVWIDTRDSRNDIYAHALATDGTFAWGSERSVCTSSIGECWDMSAIGDQQGGVFVAWADSRNEIEGDLYMSRFSYEGDRYGDLHGEAICTETNSQTDPMLVTTDEGAFVIWQDYRNGSDHDLYLQKLDYRMNTCISGGGRVLCDAVSNQWLSDAIADGNGGMYVIWRDFRYSGNGDLFTQKLYSTGYSEWYSDGIPVLIEETSEYEATMVTDEMGGFITVWQGANHGLDGELVVQRMERNGHWGYPAPDITSVQDAPADQGGQVILSWDASRLDPWPELEINEYTLWRALPTAKSSLPRVTPDWAERVAAGDLEGPVIRADDKNTYWELLEVYVAYGLPAYARTVVTWADSTGDGDATHLFQVIAHDDYPYEMWISAPDSGRSVDNLAPEMPRELTGEGRYQPEGLALCWATNAESDLAHYVVHRGATPNFGPNAGNLLAATADTTAFDVGWQPEDLWYYKVGAVDVHENVSDYALLEPNHVTSVNDGEPPAVTALVGNHPNPFNPATEIRYELAEPGHVRLKVFDAAGRLLRTIIDERRPAGRHQARWDGCDDRGRRLASGVYLYRLDADRCVQTRRMTLAR
jgi:hypothetical protein